MTEVLFNLKFLIFLLSLNYILKSKQLGISFTFGTSIVKKFVEKHNFDLICRAHQVVEDGYEFFSGRQLVTIFSAPNYCGEFDNSGALMSVDDTLMCSFSILKASDGKVGGASGLRPKTPPSNSKLN